MLAVCSRSLHRNGDYRNPADSVGMGKMWLKYHGYGSRSCGNRVGMEFIHPETPRGHFRNLANDKNSGANRILDKLSCEMSYAQNVVDSWSSFAIFWSCCKNDDIATLVKCSTPCQ